MGGSMRCPEACQAAYFGEHRQCRSVACVFLTHKNNDMSKLFLETSLNVGG